MTVTMSHRTWSVTSHKRVSRRATVVALRLPSPPERRVLRRVVLCATGDFQVRLVSSRKAGLRIADFVRHDTPDVNQDYRSDDRRGDAKEPRNCFPAACRGAGSFEGFNHWYEHGHHAREPNASVEPAISWSVRFYVETLHYPRAPQRRAKFQL